MAPPVTNGRRPEPLPPRQRPSTAIRVASGVLLAIPIVALLWVGSYAKVGPTLWGFPFFYWYTLLWLFLATGCTATAYWLMDVRGRRSGPAGPAGKDGEDR